MDRDAVSSSVLISAGYDESSLTLEVEFKDGSLYQYFDVPTSVFRELLGAPSVGQYFAQNIRSDYRYARL